MTLNATGQLSLGGSTTNQSVNVELNFPASTTNSMVSDYNKVLTAKTVGPWVFPDDWRNQRLGDVGFGPLTLAQCDVGFTDRYTGTSTLTFNTNGTVSGADSASHSNGGWAGIDYWRSGSKFYPANWQIKAKMVTQTSGKTTNWNFFGENPAVGTFSGWYNMSSARAISFTNNTNSAFSGTIQIVIEQIRTSPLTNISFTINGTVDVYSKYNPYNEVIAGPSTVEVSVPFNIVISGGKPNSTVTWVGPASATEVQTTSTITLDAAGSYTFTSVYYPTTGTKSFTATLNGSGHTRTFSVIAYNEVITAPAVVGASAGSLFNIAVTGGAPSTGVTYSGAATGSITLNSSGSYTFSNLSYTTAGTYTYNLLFAATNTTKSVTIQAYNEVITGPSAVTTTDVFNVVVSGGVPNTTFALSGSFGSGNYTLDGSGNYTFSNVTCPTAAVYNASMTFTATGLTHAYTVTSSTAMSVDILLKDATGATLATNSTNDGTAHFTYAGYSGIKNIFNWGQFTGVNHYLDTIVYSGTAPFTYSWTVTVTYFTPSHVPGPDVFANASTSSNTKIFEGPAGWDNVSSPDFNRTANITVTVTDVNGKTATRTVSATWDIYQGGSTY